MIAPAPDRSIVGLLLAGGQGRRAGLDKRYLVLQGRTLAQRNLAFLRRHFSRVVVSLAPGGRLDLGDAGEAEILEDVWPGGSPLAGIATALDLLHRPVFALAVDLAFPDDKALARVLAAAPGHDAAVPVVDGRREPLFAVYGTACLSSMTAQLQAGEHRIVDVLNGVDAAPVPFAGGGPFLNVNTPEAFELARRQAVADQPLEDQTASALVAIVARSNTGKTTLIERLIPELMKLGLRVGAIKHDAHSFEIDHPGKDSWRHGQAGAHAYVVASREKLAYVSRLDGEMALSDIVGRYFSGFDIVLAEGYSGSAQHCVEVFRLGAGYAEPLFSSGEAMALVTDAPLEHEHRFRLEDAAGLARFLAVRLETLRRY